MILFLPTKELPWVVLQLHYWRFQLSVNAPKKWVQQFKWISDFLKFKTTHNITCNLSGLLAYFILSSFVSWFYRSGRNQAWSVKLQLNFSRNVVNYNSWFAAIVFSQRAKWVWIAFFPNANEIINWKIHFLFIFLLGGVLQIIKHHWLVKILEFTSQFAGCFFFFWNKFILVVIEWEAGCILDTPHT